MQDRTPEGESNIIKPKFGRAINELVKSGIVIQEDNKFKLKNDLSLEDVKRETVIENLIFEILKVEKKKELWIEIEECASLESKKHVIRTITWLLHLPNKTEKTLEERNKQAFNMLSDEELVNKTVCMLAKWYEYNKYEVIKN